MKLSRLLSGIGFGVVACCAMTVQAGYIGESFISIPGVSGGWPGEQYHDWVKFESREWIETPTCEARQKNPMALVCDEQFWRPKSSRLIYSAPWAPPEGPGKLAVALDKRSRAYPTLMSLCEQGGLLPEVVYAESSQRSRRIGEVGQRPADIPEYFEYTFFDVMLNCPEVPDASEQAIVFSFENISWDNYQETKERKIEASPALIVPRLESGEARTFLLTWIAPSAGFHQDECPELNTEPTLDDYLALLSPEKAASERKRIEEKGGLSEFRSAISMRAPDQMNVCALPGTVPDPGHKSPVSTVARGFNLDGYIGEGEVPEGVHLHQNFVSEDGRTGIDNQMYTVEACVPGFRPEGNIPKISNAMMRNGSVTILFDISGIDDYENDSEVSVNILYSEDLMEKTADGVGVLPDYTFRITDNPEFAQFFTHFDARIEDGVVITETLDEMTFQDGGQSGFKMYSPRMRIKFEPEDQISAVMGGYYDWRRRLTNWNRSRLLEPTMRFQCPGLYHAFKRAADGLPDPVTGEFNGISVAYDIVGIPAFIPETQVASLLEAAE